jgi:TolA-binding protein
MRFNSRVRSIVAIMGLMALSSCASRTRVSESKATRIFETRVAELSESLRSKDVEITELKKSLAELEQKRIEKKFGPVHREKTKATLTEKKQGDYVVTEADFEEPATAARTAPLATAPAEDAGVAIADSRHESLHLYFDATRLLEEKKYEEAVVPLNEFLRINPSHVYADHAQFLIAKSYFLNKEYELSVVAAKQLETLYPYSLKIPESLYVRGLSYLYLNQTAPARQTLENLRERYPSGPFSDAAAKKLTQIRTAANRINRSVIGDIN